MESKTITRADLAEAVYEQVGLSRNESSDLVEVLLEEVCAALVNRRQRQDFILRQFLSPQKGPAYRPQPEDRRRSADFTKESVWCSARATCSKTALTKGNSPF
jgi:hypothetical protein